MISKGWQFVKEIFVNNAADQTKKLRITVSDDATTNTKTELIAKQTDNREIDLPNASTTLVGQDTADDLTNKTLIEVDDIILDADTISTTATNDLKLNPDGDIDASTNQIKNVAEPTSAQDASTKNYVDTEINSVTGAKATRELDNLQNTAVNADIVPDTNNTHSFGSNLLRWLNGYFNTITTGNVVTDQVQKTSGDITVKNSLDFENTETIKNIIDPTDAQEAATKNYVDTGLAPKMDDLVDDTTPTLGGNLDLDGKSIEDAENDILIAATDSVRRAKQASKSDFIEEEYVHSFTLAASQTDTAVTPLTFAHATVGAIEVTYVIKEATTNNIRQGTIRVVTNGTDVDISETYGETASTGILFDAAINGLNVEVRYDSGANSSTMRMDIKRFLV